MQGADDSLASAIARTERLGPFSANIFHVNPDQIAYLFRPGRYDVPIDGVLQTCVPFWELPRLPAAWIEPLSAMDAILAPTLFVRDSVLRDLPHARVLHYPQAVRVPEGIVADRARFGIDRDATAFCMSFDMRSDLERKNPGGVIEAFQRAFEGREDVRLVIKANNVTTAAGLPAHLDRLKAMSTDPRVTVLDRPMTYREILTLYASCDVLVSLHRAEGLGLSLLEAMALGRPVIATGWSGNMDFMTPDNSCLVPFRMVPVRASTQPAYAKGFSGEQEWADPDLDEAASWMVRLADDPSLREALGERARADATQVLAEHDRAEVFEELVKLVPDPRHASLHRIRSLYPWHATRRIARAGWRRAKAAAVRTFAPPAPHREDD